MKNYLNNVCLQKILLKVNYLFISFVYKKSIRRNQMHTALKIIFWYSLFLTIYSASNTTSILYFRKWDFLPLHFNIFQWYCTSSQSLAFYPDPVEFCIKSKKKITIALLLYCDILKDRRVLLSFCIKEIIFEILFNGVFLIRFLKIQLIKVNLNACLYM